ncbi:hypothetical protein OG302_09780 [Streptomyces sp. NBC_01283]|uniref:hypothetical protein n=1 Tax=Streptomyces sp. NBC_01283 TaxID=2903812 RepID=UPI00352F826B|nr:hypothetical protein OG302_09780 [Streptomyces sp. NBC_01283]
MTVALWTGPAAREKRNLFLSIPLVSDGKRVLDGSAPVKGVAAAPPPGESGERQGPRGFYFERPGRLTKY